MIKQHIILKAGSHFLIPFIMIFGCYILIVGGNSSGGGLQAGVICSFAFIVFSLVTTIEMMLKILPVIVMRMMLCIGPVLYITVGLIAMWNGGTFLDYSVLNYGNYLPGQHLHIMLIQLGIGITVFSVIMIIYSLFVQKGKVT